MANYSILVTSPPYDSNAGASALSFIKHALRQGHSVDHVFFYQQGIYHANTYIAPPSDEINLPDAWRELHRNTGVRLLVCITAALKRGVTDARHAAEHDITGSNLVAPFEQAGLGEFFSALHACDHVVQF